MGRQFDAIQAYRQAIQYQAINPTVLSSIYTQIGLVQYDQGTVKDSINSYLEALEEDEDNVTARVNLGWCYYIQGELEEAIKEFRQVLNRQPNIAAQFNMGLAYLHKGDIEVARIIYAQGVEIYGATNAEKIGVVEDLKRLIAQGIQEDEAQKILHAYWNGTVI